MANEGALLAAIRLASATELAVVVENPRFAIASVNR